MQAGALATLEFRDLPDTGVTRLNDAGVPLTDIALWSGHSIQSIGAILKEHHLVSTK